MKVLLFISTLILIVSCGKYEKPFITFKSPEKRITDGTWGCTKVVSEEGVEFEIEDRITFRIDGTDSIFTRITNHSALSTTPQSSELDTISGTWTWAFAHNGNSNKQMMKISYHDSYIARWCHLTVLSNKELVFQDQSLDNATYYYNKL
jgi:hypothetical protein